MAEKYYFDNPTISDTIVFDLLTTDTSGDPVDVYEIEQIIIYYIERTRGFDNNLAVEYGYPDLIGETFYQSPQPVAIFGDETTPAWLSTDSDAAFVEKIDYNDDGDATPGTYQLKWRSDYREGDYALCYRWTILPAGDVQTLVIPFYIFGDTKVTTSIPTHQTQPLKYETLVERYLPSMYKMYLSQDDKTPEILENLNLAVAKGFTDLENLANQILDLLDANVLSDGLLPYLANLFHIKLKSGDVTLWRKQIKTAVSVLKKKGTLEGLTEALKNIGVTLLRYSQLWQVKSSSLFTDGFEVTDESTFELTELAILPVDPLNFEVSLRPEGADDYQVLSNDYVSLSNSDGITTVTWIGEDLSFNPIELAEGDILKILYKISPVINQDYEDYIRTLPLFDQRDEVDVTLPKKNWNVKVIEETDDMFPLLCPHFHAYTPEVIWGKVRTIFPYGEKAYNMEEYNGSFRDSTNPCDMDKDFIEPCSCCISSKFILDVAIEDLSAERIDETWETVNEYKPFHAIAHTINYSAALSDFFLSPTEEQEVLIQLRQADYVNGQQMDFNRIIENGPDDSGALLRNMLASLDVIYTGAGTGYNNFVVMYSPGISFRSLPVNSNYQNLLEILGGSDAGEYTVIVNGDYFLRITQGSPDSTGTPIDTSEIPYRLSNVLYEQNNSSVYQNDLNYFSSETISFPETGVEVGWKLQITSGIYAGTYNISAILPDNTVKVDGFGATSSVSSLNFNLKTASLVTVANGSDGVITVNRAGLVEMDLVSVERGIAPGDFVENNGNQYLVLEVSRDTVDYLLIDEYDDGDVVGSFDFRVLRRLASGTGFLSNQGMTIDGYVPTVDDTLENDMFLENYKVLIDGNYYQITSIDGTEMELIGPMIDWGVTGTAVNYSVVQFIKTSPVTTQNSVEFYLLDRRGNDSIQFETETAMAMFSMMNSNKSGFVDFAGQTEDVQFKIEYKD